MELNRLRIKEIIIILVILLIIKFGVNVFYDSETFTFNHLKYSFYTSTINALDTEELDTLLNQEGKGSDSISIIYMGRVTCPYCVKLIPRIKTIFNTSKSIKVGENLVNVDQYYFDSEKNDNKKTSELREQIGAEYVPTIIVIKDGKVSLFTTEALEGNNYLKNFTKILNS